MKSVDIVFQQIEYGSSLYQETQKLRYNILRKPLGLYFSEEQLAEEKNDFHLAILNKNKVIACLVLSPSNFGKIKMRQVAVDENWQGKGIGSFLVTESEKFAHQLGFNLMYCSARDVAVPFYIGLNYEVIGVPFTEIGIKHLHMEKRLG